MLAEEECSNFIHRLRDTSIPNKLLLKRGDRQLHSLLKEGNQERRKTTSTFNELFFLLGTNAGIFSSSRAALCTFVGIVPV
jgi:hypothetical protein